MITKKHKEAVSNVEIIDKIKTVKSIVPSINYPYFGKI